MKNFKTYSLASLILLTGSINAQIDVTGKLIHESASFIKNGTSIGSNNPHTKEEFKRETTAKIYLDGSLGADSDSTFHIEMQAVNDGQRSHTFDDNESYTQREFFREGYIDTSLGDWLIRAGKQQVVWGTADGIKLLDSINPTDYTEMVQNQVEDSRIPVWMINADTQTESGGNWQFIISEGKSNKFAGLGVESSQAKGSITLGGADPYTEHYNSGTGDAFISKGVDTITGVKNGFLNIAPALGSAAQAFDNLAYSNNQYVGLTGYHSASVNDFATNAGGQSAGFAGVCTGGAATSAQCLSTVINSGSMQRGTAPGADNAGRQNLMPTTISNAQWVLDKDNPTYTIAYMPHATFATFDAFVNMNSKYMVSHKSRPTVAARYKDTTEGGMNYSFNIMRGNDANPYIDMGWVDSEGRKLYETPLTISSGAGFNDQYVSNLLRYTPGGQTQTAPQADQTHYSGDVGGYDGGSAGVADEVTLVMTEKLNPITQIGGSLDMSVETESLGPVVIRAEGLYQKDVMSPIITRRAPNGVDLEHGFLEAALKMEKGDRFKYVIGADITALTNMMVSLQFIQDINLDYVDHGSKNATNYWKYTGDMATMHLTNGLNKAEQFKEFYSVYLSKPYGESGQHRWNNIFMFEENGGKWNRLDTEYTINDNTVATFELNNYWGNANTQFGQFKNSSNVQVGLKYAF